MDSLKKLYSNLFQHSLKRTIYVIGGLIVVLALPITIILTQQQQDLRQRASSGETFGSNYNNNWWDNEDDDDDRDRDDDDRDGSNCSSSSNRGDNCSCSSDSQCASRDCDNRRCEGNGSGNNCNSDSNRGTGCSCSSDRQCSSDQCSSNRCQDRVTGTPTPSTATCNSSSNKPANCSCTSDSQCASNQCERSSSWWNWGGSGKCKAPSVTPSPTSSCGVNNRAAGCACQLTTQCQPGLTCFNGSCSGANPLSPTPTTGTNETRALLTVGLPGISNTPGSGSAAPKRLAREARIEVYNASNQKISDKTGNLIYDSASKLYKGTVSLGTGFSTGQYIIKVKMDNSLWKRIPGIVTITANTDNNPTTQIQLVTGDIDQNNSLTVLDYTNFVKCFKGESECTDSLKIFADLDDDGVVKDDLDDLTILQKGFAVRDGD